MFPASNGSDCEPGTFCMQTMCSATELQSLKSSISRRAEIKMSECISYTAYSSQNIMSSSGIHIQLCCVHWNEWGSSCGPRIHVFISKVASQRGDLCVPIRNRFIVPSNELCNIHINPQEKVAEYVQGCLLMWIQIIQACGQCRIHPHSVMCFSQNCSSVDSCWYNIKCMQSYNYITECTKSGKKRSCWWVR